MKMMMKMHIKSEHQLDLIPHTDRNELQEERHDHLFPLLSFLTDERKGPHEWK